MGYPGKQGKGGIEGVGKQDGPQQRHRHSSVVWGHQVEEASMRQGAPRQGLRRQGLAVPFQAQHLPSGDASDGMIDRKRGAWGHLGALSHEILEKGRNTTPWPVLRSLSIWGWGRYI